MLFRSLGKLKRETAAVVYRRLPAILDQHLAAIDPAARKALELELRALVRDHEYEVIQTVKARTRAAAECDARAGQSESERR